jgi:hypothetical protein
MLEGQLTTVIVPRQWADAAREPEGAYHLTAAVVDYVNDVQQAGVFVRREMPPKALQAYNADYYLAEVNNGGHSQFIHNSGELLPTIVGDALAGLEAMGARAQHQILTEMAAWVEANVAEAFAQDGFGTRAKPLEELDSRFYAAEGEAPIAPLAARWISSWPELRIVEDDQYAAEIERIAASNPALGQRLVWKNVENIRYQITDPLQIAISAVCGAVEPEPEVKIGVGAGFYEDIEGTQCMAFNLHTDKGERLCVPDDAGARLYEYVQSGPAPELGPDVNFEEIKNYKPPVVGARLSAVSGEAIQRFVTVANETLAPEAIDLLLRKAGLNPPAMITAWNARDGQALWIVATEQRLVVAKTNPEGAELREPEGTPVAAITRGEIERHASETAAVTAAMRPPA